MFLRQRQSSLIRRERTDMATERKGGVVSEVVAVVVAAAVDARTRRNQSGAKSEVGAEAEVEVVLARDGIGIGTTPALDPGRKGEDIAVGDGTAHLLTAHLAGATVKARKRKEKTRKKRDKKRKKKTRKRWMTIMFWRQTQ